MQKKVLAMFIFLFIITEVLTGYNKNINCISFMLINEKPIKVNVLISNFNDPYVSLIRKGLEEIQKENPGKVQYTFLDGKGNQAIQNRELTQALKRKDSSLVLLNLVDQGSAKYCIDRIKESNIPVILFGPRDIEAIRSYDKAYWIGTDATEGGLLQGKILVDLWNNYREKVDRSSDNIMQYVMLEGPSDNIYAVERTKNSILSLNNTGIQAQKLASRVCNWSEEEAKSAIKDILLRHGNKIEMIVANNDSMAIGAVKALQEYGYNHGEQATTIPVIGFDGIPEAIDLIDKGFMTGTVIQDPFDSSRAFYAIGMNLLNNKNPIVGTEYNIDDTGVSIILHYEGVKTNVV